MSKARNLSDFISDAAIDATEIGSNAVTTDKIIDQAVTPAKLHNTLDLSSKTVTLPTGGISGNAINGGVISNFASTGIDDNASSTAVTILSDGKVGIGTSSPVSAIHASGLPTDGILGTFATTAGTYGSKLAINQTGVANWRIGQPAGVDAFAFYGFGAGTYPERMRISSSGNVGIGDLGNAATLLHIGSTGTPEFRMQDLDVAGGYLSVTYNAGAATISADPTNASGSPTLAFNTNNSEAMRIDSSGRVGIGSTGPRTNLAIRVDSAGSPVDTLNLHNPSTTAGSGTQITFSGYSSESVYPTWRYGGISGVYDTTSSGLNAGGWGGQLRFFVNRGGGPDQFENVMTLTGGGRVLIGTSSQSPNTNSTLTINQDSSTIPALQFTSGDTNWWGRAQHSVEGGTIATFISSAGSWSQNGTTTNVVKDYDGSFPSAGLMMYNQLGGTKQIGFRLLRKNEGSTTTDGTVEEVASFTEDRAYIHTGIGQVADTNETTWLNGTINSLTLRVNSRPDYTTPGMAGLKFVETGWGSPVANMLITSRSGDGTERGYLSSWKFITKAGGSADNYNTALTISGGGSLSKLSGSFRIDHPLPEKAETHQLVHSFVEAPQADNLYRGRVTLVNGAADVNLDSAAGMTEGTFVLLNRDLQCFTSNETGWTAVRGSIVGNILTIQAQDNTCTDTISWMVIGERQDKHMFDTDWTDSDGHVIVEPLKESEQPE